MFIYLMCKKKATVACCFPDLHFDLFFNVINITSEPFVCFHQIVDGPAGVQHGGMVFIAAVHADGSQR